MYDIIDQVKQLRVMLMETLLNTLHIQFAITAPVTTDKNLVTEYGKGYYAGYASAVEKHNELVAKKISELHENAE